MPRIVVLGPGASGKSTFARALAAATDIELTELDDVFWSEGLEPLSAAHWREVLRDLADL